MSKSPAVGSWIRNRFADDSAVSSEVKRSAPAEMMPTELFMVQLRVDREAYRYAYEDLDDLESEVEEQNLGADTSLSFLRASLGRVRELVDRMVGIYPPPEITARDTGTVLLLWRNTIGLMSIELGEQEYGAVVAQQGRQSVYRNGDTASLLNSIPQLGVAVQTHGSVQVSRPSRMPLTSQTSPARW